MSDTIGHRYLLGMLTPSSNTVLEPVTAAMLANLPDTTAHFGRFRVTEISQARVRAGQFDQEPMLAAAELLADARVQTICWNGTSAGWLGFDADQRLCDAITARTGVQACSAVLALNEIFRLTGVRRFGLVTPYLDEIQEPIIANYAAAGFTCVAERHLGDRGNYSFSEYSESLLAQMCRDVAAAGPDAITIFCTNLRGAPIVAELEKELGVPIYDTVATAVWAAMRQAGTAPARITSWGRLFREVA
ncbi:MAG: aspartate/glutamate racemase family protein [Pseudomonadota bacterium]